MENNVTKPKFPTEIVDLPSKGLLYPKENPLSSGKIEWLSKHIGSIKVDFKQSGNKHTILDDRSIPQEERKYHILIDDHYSNLDPWMEAGGQAIKVTPTNTSAVVSKISSIQK